jgi:hypothetical protein
MKYKSPLLSQASGSVAGLTASHNKGGQYFRQRATPTNPNTPQQQVIRGLVNQLANRWVTTLLPAQRTAWNVYAANLNIADRLGDVIHLTGLNHYIRSNVPRLQAALTVVDDGPTIFTLGEYTNPTITFSAAAGDIEVDFTNTDEWAGEDDSAMLVSGSRPQTPATNYFKGPYRFADKIPGDAGTPPTTPAIISSAFAFAAGQMVFAFVRVTRADGRLSAPFLYGELAGA